MPSPVRNGSLAMPLISARIDPRAFRQGRQEGLERSSRVWASSAASRAPPSRSRRRMIAFHLEARAAGGEAWCWPYHRRRRCPARCRGRPVLASGALDVHRDRWGRRRRSNAAEVGQGVAHRIRTLAGVDPVDAGAAAHEGWCPCRHRAERRRPRRPAIVSLRAVAARDRVALPSPAVECRRRRRRRRGLRWPRSPTSLLCPLSPSWVASRSTLHVVDVEVVALVLLPRLWKRSAASDR